MKTYTGTVILRLYHQVTVELPDDADKDDIEQAMLEYYDLNNCKDHAEETDAEVFDIEEVKE